MTDMAVEEQVDILNDLAPYEDDGKDRLTHIISPPENMHVPHSPNGSNPAQEIVNTARFLRLEIVALCGHTWVPVHNPEKYPVCQACVDTANNIIKEHG